MNYPTLEEVEAADRMQICRWYRFLPSPGIHAVGVPDCKESKIMDRIVERWRELGGFTPEISKALGWGK